jgi:hypothetical protein
MEISGQAGAESPIVVLYTFSALIPGSVDMGYMV